MHNVLRGSGGTTPERVLLGSNASRLPRALVGVLAASTALSTAVLIWQRLPHHPGGGRQRTREGALVGAPDEKISGSVQGGEEENMFSLAGPPRLFVSNSNASQEKKVSDRPSGSPLQSNAVESKGALAVGVLSSSEVWTSDIVARGRELNLARALLRRVEGVEYEESSDDETPSDETDVSLNYCTATELELKSRDELMEVFSYYENAQQAGARSPDGKDSQEMINDMGFVLAKIVEYLDISNEREKLRVRREAKRYADGKEALGKFTSSPAEDLPKSSKTPLDAGLRVGDSWQGPGPNGVPSSRNQLNLLDRMLEQRETQGETFEESWSNDDEETQAFMEFLQQDDAAPKFFTREEVRRNRQNRLRPASQNCIDDDVYVVTADGQDFNDVIARINDDMEPNMDDDSDYDLHDGDFPFEDADEPTNSWSNAEKAEFEANLILHLHSLAEAMGVTELLSEREALQLDAENERRREARRQLAAKKSMAAPFRGQGDDDDSEVEWEDTDDES